ncbi:B12-binding domain-containing radical SAM protein [Paraliomyxa miuraensis]|uniref:B12-binding domain-containing radical SAM protein n=1 Tax=Paraliomyxa miuraensis TaxID=376150 RepID=UPI00224DFFE5|nr:radical SAM protein [Paraliomyxa miuraensis]MCX4245103.1 cobalamin-dependent protein [Paraliomyxa miuraensis]
MSTDLLLLFPGVTEARFFPYLSLPTLTGYLRARGHAVVQRDLNIALLERLSVAPAGSTASASGRSQVTPALQAFVADHGEEIRRTAFGREASRFPWNVAAKLAWTHALRAMDGSTLTRRLRRLRDVVDHAFVPVEPSDLADQVHTELVGEAMAEARPRVVGLSVAYFSQLVPALRIARFVREHHPGTTVVLGGAQITMRAGELARDPRVLELVDALVEGAGEPALDALLSGATTVPGALTRAGSAPAAPHHLRDNPTPDFDGLPVTRYLTEEIQLPVVGTVGCYWGRCVFCSYGNRTLEVGYQQLRPEQLADVCESGLRSTGARFIVFVDENTNLRLVLGAARRLAERGRRVEWASRNRLERDLAEPAFCRALAEAGCRMMSVGYETNVQRLLDLMDKGVDASLYQRIIDNLHEVGINLRFSVMGGLFDETPQEARQSREFLIRNADKIGIDVAQMMIVEPTSRLSADPEGHGLVVDADEQQLVANESFSYLGGRVGVRHGFASGEGWDERTAQLAELVDRVLPEKNDDRHPRFLKAPPVRPGGVTALRLHPWVVRGEQGRLVDLRQSLVLRPSDDWGYDEATHVLSAATERGRVVLDRLLHAGLGEA